jgi:hypothetical protein
MLADAGENSNSLSELPAVRAMLFEKLSGGNWLVMASGSPSDSKSTVTAPRGDPSRKHIRSAE